MSPRTVCLALAATTLLLGCATHVQTTSGAEYLSDHPAPRPARTVSISPPGGEERVDTLVREAAAIEPTLRFPARLGLARIAHGALTPIPEDEAVLWKELADGLGNGFGELIPVSPLVAALTAGRFEHGECPQCRDTVNRIRLASASQHLHAVLVYEIIDRSKRSANVLSIANLSIIGGFILPTTSLHGEVIVQAMLIDVLQGYPYATTRVQASEETLTTTWGSRDSDARFGDVVRESAIRKLTAELRETFMKLRMDLAQRRTAM